MNKPKAEIVDIFSSVQGEGIFLGARQIFVRFKRCNLACVFCDEPREHASRLYSPTELIEEIRSLEKGKSAHHSVSLTGGEPLLYTDFLKAFLPLLKKEGMKSYLETNGTLPQELGEVIDLVDIVAMDIKLPSSTLERPFWERHGEFLKIASKKKVFVKAIVTPETTKEDIEKTIDVVNSVGKHISLILQPATPMKASDKAVPRDRLLEFMEIGIRNHLENIRVIPQLHKLIGVK